MYTLDAMKPDPNAAPAKPKPKPKPGAKKDDKDNTAAKPSTKSTKAAATVTAASELYLAPYKLDVVVVGFDLMLLQDPLLTPTHSTPTRAPSSPLSVRSTY